MSSLKIAVVGLGLGRHFVRTLAGHSDVDCLILCDADADRSEELRQAHPEVSAIYEQLGVMLEKERPDAVCVVTPDHLHRPHSTLCMESGSHVLQTKPLATNLDDARAIVASAEATGKKLMVAHERRFRPQCQRVKALIEEGEIGDLIHLRVDAIADKRGQFKRAPWYASPEAGRSALNGTGIHEVDLIRYYTGRPIEAVSAFGNRLGGLDFPKDKTTAAVFRFEGDVIGQVTVTYEAQQPRGKHIDDHLRIVGTEGTIIGDRLYRVGEEDWEDLSGHSHDIRAGLQGAVLAFVDSLVNDTPIAVTGEDAFDSLAAADAADQSAARGEILRPESLK